MLLEEKPFNEFKVFKVCSGTAVEAAGRSVTPGLVKVGMLVKLEPLSELLNTWEFMCELLGTSELISEPEFLSEPSSELNKRSEPSPELVSLSNSASGCSFRPNTGFVGLRCRKRRR